MSEEDRIKWNQRYAEGTNRKHNPVTLLQRWLPRIEPGKALDVACGSGRNAVPMAQAGFCVDAIDISAEGLTLARRRAAEAGVEINWIEHDLDQAFEFDRDYDLILVLWFVNLPLIASLCDCLAPGGYLLVEEHLITAQETAGPGNDAFRVAPGALRDAIAALEILEYAETIETGADGEAVASARAVCRRPRYRG